MNYRDEKGARMGSKTATLEMLGVLIHFLHSKDQMRNQHLVFKTDNLACVYGWENKCVKFDICASIVIRTIALLGAALGSIIHVIHLPRRSSWEAVLVDNLSRRSTSFRSERELVNRFKKPVIPPSLSAWLGSPSADWELPQKIVSEILNNM
jgi:hypothetical protein